MDEEIKIRLNIDNKSLKQGLDSAKALVEQFVHGFSHSINHIFKEFSAPLTVAGIVAGLEKAMDMAKQIERIGQATGLGAETWQKMAYQAKLLGVNTEEAEKWMGHLSDTIGQAREGETAAIERFEKWNISLDNAAGSAADVSEIVENIAIKMGEAKDPTEKAAIAVDLFGRHASKMVAILSEWRAKHGAGASILNNDDISVLKDANKEIEEFLNKLTILEAKSLKNLYKEQGLASFIFSEMGRAFSGTDVRASADMEANLSTLRKLAEMKRETKSRMEARAISDATKNKTADQNFNEAMEDASAILKKAAFEEMNEQGKLKSLQKERLDLMKRFHEEQFGTQTQANLIREIAQKDLDIAKEKHKIETESSKLKLEISNTQDRITFNQKKERERGNAEFMPSLEQMADSGHWDRPGASNRHWIESPYRKQAQEALEIQKRIAHDKLYNPNGALNSDVDRLKQLRGQLSDAGVMSPDMRLQSIDESLKQNNEHLNKLYKLGDGLGFNMRPVLK